MYVSNVLRRKTFLNLKAIMKHKRTKNYSFNDFKVNSKYLKKNICHK